MFLHITDGYTSLHVSREQALCLYTHFNTLSILLSFSNNTHTHTTCIVDNNVIKGIQDRILFGF